MRWLDSLLNRVTMYRLLLYYLVGLTIVAVGLSLADYLRYAPLAVALSAGWFVGACWLVNRLFALIFHAPVHNDSAYITGLILALIITPFRGLGDGVMFILAPVLAMAGKYIVAIHRHHLFNPAALGVVLTALVLGRSASWWVGSTAMVPAVVFGGFLLVWKLRRWDIFSSFIVTAAVATMIGDLTSGMVPLEQLRKFLIASPALFFGFVMLVEPVTVAPTHRWRVAFGVLIGLLFMPQIHVGNFYFTPEYALLLGNAVFYFLTRRERYIFRLTAKNQLAPSIQEFVFAGPNPDFKPGQYFEWTNPHRHNDGRGLRRYFTIASSPTEPDVRLGIKFYPKPSTYKHALADLPIGGTVVASQLDGDFTLPNDPKRPLVFLAGGIGVTPFRSMIKYLLDRHESRPITMLYANQTAADVVYRKLFDQAERELGIRTVYTLSDEKSIPSGWTGQRGYITPEMIRQEVPEWTAAWFYISGPQAMVTNYKTMLRRTGIRGGQIKTDYFPGFA